MCQSGMNAACCASLSASSSTHALALFPAPSLAEDAGQPAGLCTEGQRFWWARRRKQAAVTELIPASAALPFNSLSQNGSLKMQGAAAANASPPTAFLTLRSCSLPVAPCRRSPDHSAARRHHHPQGRRCPHFCRYPPSSWLPLLVSCLSSPALQPPPTSPFPAALHLHRTRPTGQSCLTALRAPSTLASCCRQQATWRCWARWPARATAAGGRPECRHCLLAVRGSATVGCCSHKFLPSPAASALLLQVPACAGWHLGDRRRRFSGGPDVLRRR